MCHNCPYKLMVNEVYSTIIRIVCEMQAEKQKLNKVTVRILRKKERKKKDVHKNSKVYI